MSDRVDEVLAAARAAIGPCEVVADRSWPAALAVVLELETTKGRVIAKGHAEQRHFDCGAALLEGHRDCADQAFRCHSGREEPSSGHIPRAPTG